MDEDEGRDEGRDQGQDDTPWEVSEYRYQPPLLLELLFSPFGQVPLAALILVALWRWLS